VQRIVEPKIVYRDRIRYVDNSGSAINQSQSAAGLAHSSESNGESRYGIGNQALQSLKDMTVDEQSVALGQSTSDGSVTSAVAPSGMSLAAAQTMDGEEFRDNADALNADPNVHLTNSVASDSPAHSEARSDASADSELPDEKETANRYSLMQDGFDLLISIFDFLKAGSDSVRD